MRYRFFINNATLSLRYHRNDYGTVLHPDCEKRLSIVTVTESPSSSGSVAKSTKRYALSGGKNMNLPKSLGSEKCPVSVSPDVRTISYVE